MKLPPVTFASLLLAFGLGSFSAWLVLKPAAPALNQDLVSFSVRELHQLGEAAPAPRNVFLVGERPILLIAGPGAIGKEVFVELLYNERPFTISPPKVSFGNTWYSMGQGDLPNGHYHAQLYLAGEASAAVDFTILK